jgi:tRNA modification GTPase
VGQNHAADGNSWPALQADRRVADRGRGACRWRAPPWLDSQVAVLTNDRDTIFALSSGRPPAAIAVIRISGPEARQGLMATYGRVPEPRRATFARLRDPLSQEMIDEALVLWFPGPGSETGEDMVELQLHGGRAIVARVFAVLGQLDRFRMAEPGEFTRRAFENGRLDLTAVEGLADLIYADTEAQRRQAFRQFKGLLGNRAETWRERLIDALALVEAGIDFSDEGDVPGDLAARAFEIIGPLASEIRQAGAGQGERLREGLAVAIAGPPNVGKSTLLNRLARRDAAIVSPHAGTTRDVIEVQLDLAGFPVILRDTAGLREASDPVEQEGVRRAQDAVTDANLVLWVVDAAGIDAGMSLAQQQLSGAHVQHWIILNKTDLLAPGAAQEFGSRIADQAGVKTLLTISATSGAGIDDLVRALAAFAERFFTDEPALVTRERHRVALREAGQALDGALRLGPQGGEELVAEQVRLATRALERLTGRVGVEDILDVIFRDFCIGK